MSIIRVGLSETKDFSDGWDRIFGKKDQPAPAPSAGTETPETQAQPATETAQAPTGTETR